jgi:formyltetrahydrofolate synthetase
VVAGYGLDKAYTEENLGLLEKGIDNLAAHIENVKKFGIPAVVAINRFPTDTDAEVELVRQMAIQAGAEEAVMTDHFSRGGAGSTDLAQAVVDACEKPSNFEFLYPSDWGIKQKIEKIATDIYGAEEVTYEPLAEKQIKRYESLGFGNLPMCMAKTHLSISHDATLKGRPTGFSVPIREVRLSAGAGFIYPLLGTMRTMPGLPSKPAFMNVDYDFETGKVVGLF